MIARHVLVSGTVQGVFFRATCSEMARRSHVTGWVRNLPDGRVEAWFEGRSVAVEKAVEWCRQGPPRARVANVTVGVVTPAGYRDFTTR